MAVVEAFWAIWRPSRVCYNDISETVALLEVSRGPFHLCWSCLGPSGGVPGPSRRPRGSLFGRFSGVLDRLGASGS
eukprot:7447501-Pyramimonas_sp.AAC.1